MRPSTQPLHPLSQSSSLLTQRLGYTLFHSLLKSHVQHDWRKAYDKYQVLKYIASHGRVIEILFSLIILFGFYGPSRLFHSF